MNLPTGRGLLLYGSTVNYGSSLSYQCLAVIFSLKGLEGAEAVLINIGTPHHRQIHHTSYITILSRDLRLCIVSILKYEYIRIIYE